MIYDLTNSLCALICSANEGSFQISTKDILAGNNVLLLLCIYRYTRIDISLRML